MRVQILAKAILLGSGSRTTSGLWPLGHERLLKCRENNPLLPRHRVAILVALNLLNEREKLKAEHGELLALMEEAN